MRQPSERLANYSEQDPLSSQLEDNYEYERAYEEASLRRQLTLAINDLAHQRSPGTLAYSFYDSFATYLDCRLRNEGDRILRSHPSLDGGEMAVEAGFHSIESKCRSEFAMLLELHCPGESPEPFYARARTIVRQVRSDFLRILAETKLSDFRSAPEGESTELVRPWYASYRKLYIEIISHHDSSKKAMLAYRGVSSTALGDYVGGRSVGRVSAEKASAIEAAILAEAERLRLSIPEALKARHSS